MALASGPSFWKSVDLRICAIRLLASALPAEAAFALRNTLVAPSATNCTPGAVPLRFAGVG